MCKFKLSALTTTILIMGAIQGIICLLAFVVVPATGKWYQQWFPLSWSVTSMNYVSGLVLFFAMLGVLGLVTLIIRMCSAMCSCCCQCCYDPADSAYHRQSHYYYTGYNPYFFCFFPLPDPYYHHHHVHHAGGCGNCACLGCGDCNCSGGSNDNNGAALLIVILVLAVIGVIFAIIITTLLVGRLMKRHAEIAKRYHEAREHRVKDIGHSARPTAYTSDARLKEFV